jgi:hypothetical protein
MANTEGSDAFFALVNSGFRMRLFLLAKLPSAFFSGVRVAHADAASCRVTVPYTWFSKNPFRSTYFACLAMAAEMSTGLLAMAHLYQRKPAVSMLVIGLQAQYFKKATGLTSFSCTDGEAIAAAIEKAVITGEPQQLAARATGTNAAGEPVAEFLITWSFKSKSL